MNGQIANEIQAEQCAGRQKYGKGPFDYNHDDETADDLWHELIEYHNERGCSATPMDRRQELVKVAGLAVSAIESFDREQQREFERERQIGYCKKLNKQ